MANGPNIFQMLLVCTKYSKRRLIHSRAATETERRLLRVQVPRDNATIGGRRRRQRLSVCLSVGGEDERRRLMRATPIDDAAAAADGVGSSLHHLHAQSSRQSRRRLAYIASDDSVRQYAQSCEVLLSACLSVCLSVRLFVCPRAYLKTRRLYFTIFRCIMPAAMAQLPMAALLNLCVIYFRFFACFSHVFRQSQGIIITTETICGHKHNLVRYKVIQREVAPGRRRISMIAF